MTRTTKGKDAAPRRRTRGGAWYWRQTDSWYFTPPGTKRRVRLLDAKNRPIRGEASRTEADLALAQIKASGNWRPSVSDLTSDNVWTVARVCSVYVEHCRLRASRETIASEYFEQLSRFLNALCEYCGALPVSELRKGHIEVWLTNHPQWQSPVTRRNAITSVLAAFRFAQEQHDVSHLLKGLKKPPQRPRLLSISPEDEELLYSATDEAFRDFLFAAIHTGLRPFCELARLKPENVIESDRGMLWRVYSSKNKKTRIIPIRSEVAEMVRERIERGTADQTVFRNTRGGAWTKVTAVGRFLDIKRRLGWEHDPLRKRYSCYICRHSFAHRMLAGYWNQGEGCSIEVLAELMGDTPKVAFDHYGREWGQHYQDPLWAAIGVD